MRKLTKSGALKCVAYVLALLLCALPARAANPTFVQSNEAENGVGSQAVAYSVNVTSGNALVIAVFEQSAGSTLGVSSTVSTGCANAWTVVGAARTFGATSTAQIWTSFASATGACTVTFTSSVSTFMAGFVTEYTWPTAVFVVDDLQDSHAAATTQSSLSLNVTKKQEVLIVFSGNNQADASLATAGAPFTIRAVPNNNQAIADDIVPGAGGSKTCTTTFALSGAVQSWGVGLATSSAGFGVGSLLLGVFP